MQQFVQLGQSGGCIAWASLLTSGCPRLESTKLGEVTASMLSPARLSLRGIDPYSLLERGSY
jgi:hypothetical protein